MPKATGKVLCRTPTPGKKPTRIDRWKFDAVRRAILKVVPKKGDGLLFSDLTEKVESALKADELKNLGASMWYVTVVKLELEVCGELKRVKDATPQRLLKK